MNGGKFYHSVSAALGMSSVVAARAASDPNSFGTRATVRLDKLWERDRRHFDLDGSFLGRFDWYDLLFSWLWIFFVFLV